MKSLKIRTDGRTEKPWPRIRPPLRARTGGKDAPFGGGRAAPHLTPIFSKLDNRPSFALSHQKGFVL